MKVAIFNSAILNSAMLDSDTAILDSDTLLSLLRYTQKHSHSTLTLTQTNLIWLKLIHSSLNLMMAAILNSAILDSASALWNSDTLLSSLRITQKHSHSTLTLAQTNLIWLKLKHSYSTDFGSLLEFCHLEFSHPGFRNLSFSSQTHSYLPRLVPTICTKKKLHSHFPPTICTKKTSLIHSDSTYWWWPSWILPYWILPYWIQLLHCGIQASCFLLSDSFKNPLPPLWLWHKLIQFD